MLFYKSISGRKLNAPPTMINGDIENGYFSAYVMTSMLV